MNIHNMTGNLPAEGKKIYEAVYKKAIDDGDSEETASKKAWGACKRAGWKKDKDDQWVKKNYAIFENAPFVNGGRGSGNYGHKGRPGLRGGSGSGGGSSSAKKYNTTSKVSKLAKGTSKLSEKEKEKKIKEFEKYGDDFTSRGIDAVREEYKAYTSYLFETFGEENVNKGNYPDEYAEYLRDLSDYEGLLIDARFKSVGNASAETPDYTDSSMVAFMLPDEVKEKIKAAFPFIEDDVYNTLHLTLAFLGDTETTDTIKALKAMFEASDYFPTIKGSIQGLARFISGGEQDAFVLTFDSPDMPKLHTRLSNALEWKGVNTPKDHGFIPHITIAYIGAEDEIPADTFDPIEMTIDHIALVNGNRTFLTVPLWQDDRMGEVARNSIASPKPGNWLVTLLSKFNKENKPMDKFKELVQKILNEAGWKVVFNDANQTASATPNSPTASPTLIGLESVVNEMGGVDKFAEVIKNMANLPAQIQALSEQMNGISGSVEAAKTLAQNAAQAAESEKKDIVGRLIANGSCPLPEAVLNTLALDDLKKLEKSYQPTNYAALGGFVTNTNPGGGNELPLGLPSYFETAEVN